MNYATLVCTKQVSTRVCYSIFILIKIYRSEPSQFLNEIQSIQNQAIPLRLNYSLKIVT